MSEKGLPQLSKGSGISAQVNRGRAADFSLDELRVLLPGDLASWEHVTVPDTLRRKVGDIEALQTRPGQNKAHLVELIAQIEAKPQDMDCGAHARSKLSDIRQVEAESIPTPRKIRRCHKA